MWISPSFFKRFEGPTSKQRPEFQNITQKLLGPFKTTVSLETDFQNLQLINGNFMTISGNFFEDYCKIA